MIESSLHQSEPVLLPGRPSGRQVRGVIGYSLLTAMMIASEVVVFVPAALWYCARRHGRRAAWAALVLSLAIASLFAAAEPASTAVMKMMDWVWVAGVMLALALPSMAAIPMVERGEPFGRVLLFLLAGGMVGLAMTEVASQLLMGFSPHATLIGEMKEFFRQGEAFYRKNNAPAEFVRLVQRSGPTGAFLFPAHLVMLTAMTHVLSLMMYGRLRALEGPAEERPYLFRNFALPEWVLFAFVFGGLTPLTTGMMQKVAANVLYVVAVLYVLQGIAVFRSMLLSIGAGPAGTIFGWGLLAVTLPFSLLAIGIAGLFDSFFDFRHFKKRKDDSNESHSD